MLERRALFSTTETDGGFGEAPAETTRRRLQLCKKRCCQLTKRLMGSYFSMHICPRFLSIRLRRKFSFIRNGWRHRKISMVILPKRYVRYSFPNKPSTDQLLSPDSNPGEGNMYVGALPWMPRITEIFSRASQSSLSDLQQSRRHPPSFSTDLT